MPRLSPRAIDTIAGWVISALTVGALVAAALYRLDH